MKLNYSTEEIKLTNPLHTSYGIVTGSENAFLTIKHDNLCGYREAESLSGLQKKALYNEINNKVTKWIKEVEDPLSDLFKNRFISNKPSIFSNYKVIKNSFLEPKGFSDLTLQQASMIVSSLLSIFQTNFKKFIIYNYNMRNLYIIWR